LFAGDGDSGSGEMSGDDASDAFGSGQDPERVQVKVKDMWQLASSTSRTVLAEKRSGAANQGCVLSLVLAVTCSVVAAVFSVLIQ